MDKKKIEQLYKLLERAEKEHDTEAASALRWAIFRLESQDLRSDYMIQGNKVYDVITNTWSTGYWIPLYCGNIIVQYVPVWKRLEN